MSVLCVLTFVNVVSRFVFNISLSFTEELTTNLFVFIIFIGASILAKEGGHLSFNLLSEYIPKRLRLIQLILIGVLITIFFILLTWYGIQTMVQQYQYGHTTPAMKLPSWLFGMAIPLGSILCIVRFWQSYILNIKKIIRLKE